MSPRLRPLRLPMLVEQRKKIEAQNEMDGDILYTYTIESRSSGATSPVSPKSSIRGHLRYSSSTSSFELATVPSPEGPSSPVQVSHKSNKRALPDVQEEPVDHLDSDDDVVSDHFDLYDCLCHVPCIHKDTILLQSTTDIYTCGGDIDYEIGLLSDSDFNTSPRKTRGDAESPFTGLTQRFGSRFPSLTRWKSTRKNSITNSPVSDFGFDSRPAHSRAASSRSSSLSACGGRYQPDRTNEPPLPPTPALSFYESSESINSAPAPLDIEKANAFVPLIEQERALATTPLLPPLVNPYTASTAQSSPLESPTIAGSLSNEPQLASIPTPPLSTKPSNSSLHRIVTSVELPNIPEPDEWSDRLGHANFTILPQPYKPETMDVDSLRQLQGDWANARINYTKHLVRTGEHYGITSKTYALTEAKWAETDRAWRAQHNEVVEAVVTNGEAADAFAKFDEAILTTVPQMDHEGKFPERGDEDIVGPMVREATMSSSSEGLERKSPSFWRNLAGRVGLRK